jgi:hypothetical protein
MELIAHLLEYLTRFSVQSRYPGESATVKEADRALEAAREVRKFFANRVPEFFPGNRFSRRTS